MSNSKLSKRGGDEGRSELPEEEGSVALAEEPEEKAGAPDGPAPVIHEEVEEEADEQEREREKAFAAEPMWRGQPVKLTISRETTFEQLRAAVGAPRWDAVTYEAFLADAIRLLYLCTHEPADYRAVRSDAVAFQEAIDAWAEEEIAEGELGEVRALMFDVWVGRNKNKPEPAESGEGRAVGN